MSRRARLLIVAALALTAIAAYGGPATAASFSLSPAGAIELVSLGKLTIESGVSISCNWTLRGTLSRALIPKTRGAQFGSLTAARIANCEGGSFEIPLIDERTRAWPLEYEAILGTLPNSVTGLLLLIEGFNLKLNIFFEILNCLYQGNLGALLPTTLNEREDGRGRPAVYTLGLARVLAERSRLVVGEVGCPSEVGYRGSFATTPTQQFRRLP